MDPGHVEGRGNIPVNAVPLLVLDGTDHAVQKLLIAAVG
jgi:hypothetical protein